MGFFDIFKKQKSEQISENLTLEDLLKKAAAQPIFRKEFYKRLLSDDLIVITHGANIPTGSQTLEKDTTVNIVSLSDGKIPVFTSNQRIFDKGIIKEQVHYLQIKGENLFQITSGATLLLNPYSDYGKELLPDEIQNLLNGTLFTNNLQTIRINKKTEVQIGEPAIFPSEMIGSLKELLSDRKYVEAAYLGWIYYPESEEPPHYIIGIEGEGDLKLLTQEAGFIAQQFFEKRRISRFY